MANGKKNRITPQNFDMEEARRRWAEESAAQEMAMQSSAEPEYDFEAADRMFESEEYPQPEEDIGLSIYEPTMMDKIMEQLAAAEQAKRGTGREATRIPSKESESERRWMLDNHGRWRNRFDDV